MSMFWRGRDAVVSKSSPTGHRPRQYRVVYRAGQHADYSLRWVCVAAQTGQNGRGFIARPKTLCHFINSWNMDSALQGDLAFKFIAKL
jgi:hypothetical protein